MTIVFYDGECGLCQRSIVFLVHADKERKLLFAPLNGETFRKFYGDTPSLLTSVIVYSEGKSFEKSDALFKLCSILGGFYRFFFVFKLIPRFILDAIYNLVASQRKKMKCRLVIKDDRFIN